MKSWVSDSKMNTFKTIVKIYFTHKYPLTSVIKFSKSSRNCIRLTLSKENVIFSERLLKEVRSLWAVARSEFWCRYINSCTSSLYLSWKNKVKWQYQKTMTQDTLEIIRDKNNAMPKQETFVSSINPFSLLLGGRRKSGRHGDFR